MKGFRKLIVITVICMAVIAVIVNLIAIIGRKGDEGRPYRVEAERIVYAIEHGNDINISGYKYITGVTKLESVSGHEKTNIENLKEYFDAEDDYLLKVVNGEIYRFDYSIREKDNIDKTLIIVNVCLGISFLFIILLLIYLKVKLIGPFNKMVGLPSELAKGNITAPIEAEKNKYFGEFTWGLNLLRERLEKGKQDDLEAKKNNKSLILSLSHDIKTPLGIIELNSKALQRGLYDNDKEKKDRIAGVINEKCGEIKDYVDQIIKASKEDFLELEVNNSDFYLSKIVENIRNVYADKLELLQIGLKIEDYSDCMLKGDIDRAIEVLQNLMENAVKYGDGKEIKISFSREENSQLVSVSNTGCTLSDSELLHIFDSFWRGSNVGTNNGSGLGLYICKQLMNRMNGDIFAEIHDGKMIVTAVFGMS